MTVGVRVVPKNPREWGPWEFRVNGPLIGHKCSAAAAFDDGFRAYKRTVRLLANVAGVPSMLNPKGIYTVTTDIFFRLKARTDVENVRKSIIDALWDRDRRVLNGSYRGMEHHGSEYAVVVIERVR